MAWHGLPVVHRKLCEHVASAALAPCLMQEACEMIQNWVGHSFGIINSSAKLGRNKRSRDSRVDFAWFMCGPASCEDGTHMSTMTYDLVKIMMTTFFERSQYNTHTHIIHIYIYIIWRLLLSSKYTNMHLHTIICILYHTMLCYVVCTVLKILNCITLYLIIIIMLCKM